MTSEEERNLAIIRRVLAGYGRVQIDAWLEDYAPNAIYEEPGYSGRMQDRATLRQALALQFAAHPDLTFLVHEISALGGRVVVEGEARWQEGGRTRVLQQALFYELHDGKIRRTRVYAQARP